MLRTRYFGSNGHLGYKRSQFLRHDQTAPEAQLRQLCCANAANRTFPLSDSKRRYDTVVGIGYDEHDTRRPISVPAAEQSSDLSCLQEPTLTLYPKARSQQQPATHVANTSRSETQQHCNTKRELTYNMQLQQPITTAFATLR